MKFVDAVISCHVRSAIYREVNPSNRYYKNHTIALEKRVPESDQAFDDWKEYDPRVDVQGSLFMFND